MDNKPPEQKGSPKTLWYILGGSLLALAFMNAAQKTIPPATEAPLDQEYTTLIKNAQNGRIKKIVIRQDTGEIIALDKNDNKLKSLLPPNENIVERLKSAPVEIAAIPPIPPEKPSALWSFLLMMAPMLLFIAVWIYFMRKQMGASGGGAFSFGKSKAREMNGTQKRVTFADVAGIENVKGDATDFVEFLKNPLKFSKLGAKIPRGALLVGPPGTGKTLLARAIAGEANVPFFSISGSDFVEMFVGVGAARVRDMFKNAKAVAPCIIFIDEIDAVGKARGSGMAGGNDEREQTLNQILVEMDGFEGNQGVIILAATNRPDVLDKALLRPGRFDRQIVIPLPDVHGREQILKVHARGVPLAGDADLKIIARGTPGFSGADLANLINEAALWAARQESKFVTLQHIEYAKDKIMMGSENKTMAMTDREKENTAYHEAGHGLISVHLRKKWGEGDPIHKATIIPRGQALGMVMTLPEGDRVSVSYQWLIARLTMLYGGRIAEEVRFGKDKITTGASNDIQVATELATRMVTEWGYSDRLGKRRYVTNQQEAFLGQMGPQNKAVSNQKQHAIDSEIDRLLQEAEKTARDIIAERKDDFERFAQALLKFETLTGQQVEQILDGGDPDVIMEAARIAEESAAMGNGGNLTAIAANEDEIVHFPKPERRDGTSSPSP